MIRRFLIGVGLLALPAALFAGYGSNGGTGSGGVTRVQSGDANASVAPASGVGDVVITVVPVSAGAADNMGTAVGTKTLTMTGFGIAGATSITVMNGNLQVFTVTSTGMNSNVPMYITAVQGTNTPANPSNVATGLYVYLVGQASATAGAINNAIIGYTYSTQTYTLPGGETTGVQGIGVGNSSAATPVFGVHGQAWGQSNEIYVGGVFAESNYKTDFATGTNGYITGVFPFLNITNLAGTVARTTGIVTCYLSLNPNIGRGADNQTYGFLGISTYPHVFGVTNELSLGGQGSVGIGTSRPTQKLEIHGISPGILIHDISGGAVLVQQSNGGFGVVETSGTPAQPLLFGVGNQEAGRILATKSLFWLSGSTWTGVVWSTPGFNGGASTLTQIMINGVAYQWPSSQGAAGTFMRNDGTGIMTWATPASGTGSSLVVQNSTGGAWTTAMSSMATSSSGRFVSLVQFQLQSGSFTLISPSTQAGSFGQLVLLSTDGAQTFFHATSTSIAFSTAAAFNRGLSVASTFYAPGLIDSNSWRWSTTPCIGCVPSNTGDGTLTPLALVSASATWTDNSTYTHHVTVTGGRPALQEIVNGVPVFEIGMGSATFSTPTVINANLTATQPTEFGSSTTFHSITKSTAGADFTSVGGGGNVIISSLSHTCNEQIDFVIGSLLPTVSSGGVLMGVYKSTAFPFDTQYLAFSSTQGDVNYVANWWPQQGFVGSTFTFSVVAFTTSAALTPGQNAAFSIAAASLSSGTFFNQATFTSSQTVLCTLNGMTQLAFSTESAQVTISNYVPGQPVQVRFSRNKASGSDNAVGQVDVICLRFQYKRKIDDF